MIRKKSKTRDKKSFFFFYFAYYDLKKWTLEIQGKKLVRSVKLTPQTLNEEIDDLKPTY